jgi:hypothetical protein
VSLERLYKVDISTADWVLFLKQTVARLQTAGNLKRVIVFGSFALRQMTQGSDVDLLIVVDDSEDPRKFRRNFFRPPASWPTDLIIVTQSRFDERKDFGGVIMEAVDTGVELFPVWKWREGA